MAAVPGRQKTCQGEISAHLADVYGAGVFKDTISKSTEVISSTSCGLFVLGEYEGGLGDVADFAGAGGDAA